LDFDEDESNAFVEAFGKEIANVLRGCSSVSNACGKAS